MFGWVVAEGGEFIISGLVLEHPVGEGILERDFVSVVCKFPLECVGIDVKAAL